jgi:hypothetical protein
MKDTAILIQIENRVPTQMKEGFGLIYSETKSLQRLKTKTRDNLSVISRYVPGAGIEPARPYGHQILSLTCLPIPPSGRVLERQSYVVL